MTLQDQSSSRVDSYEKATGAGAFTADVNDAATLWIALTRSPFAAGAIKSIDTSTAAKVPGVAGFLDGRDLRGLRYGRGVRDVPVLAEDEVRYIGEPVVAVVAETRHAAEWAAELVDVDYEPRPPVLAANAQDRGTALVHAEPQLYQGADPGAADGRNLQGIVTFGDREQALEAIAKSPHVVNTTYATPAVHQGYLEPHACMARVDDEGGVHLWATNKSPYLLRAQVAACLGVPVNDIVVHPVFLGADFGGKGSPMHAALCVEVARRFQRPAKLVMRYNDELIGGNPRHPSRINVSLGADEDGTFSGLAVDATLDGGAYGGFKFWPTSVSAGVLHSLFAYTWPVFACEARTIYSNAVPKGHMRAPGMTQGIFALESAIDELAVLLDMDPGELRMKNVAAHGATGDPRDVLQQVAARRQDRAVSGPPRLNESGTWRVGRGLALDTSPGGVTSDETFINMLRTSLRLRACDDGTIEVETSTPETGAGSHTVLRNLLATELGIEREGIEIIQATTGTLEGSVPAGASQVTSTFSGAVRIAGSAWRSRGDSNEVLVEYVPGGGGPYEVPGGSVCVQEAVVAVDLDTGQVQVAEINSFVEVEQIVNPGAHQMQIDGGTTMGFGGAVMEDLCVEDGQIGAAQLGEYKIPSVRDVPQLTTTLIDRSSDQSPARALPIGEATNVPTAPAIANAIYNAVGVRIRDLPITAEKVYNALRAGSGGATQES